MVGPPPFNGLTTRDSAQGTFPVLAVLSSFRQFKSYAQACDLQQGSSALEGTGLVLGGGVLSFGSDLQLLRNTVHNLPTLASSTELQQSQ